MLGNANPVSGPYFNLSTVEPTGVVAIAAPQDSSLLGLVSVIAPAIAVGCTVVVVTSYARPLPAVTLAEVLATSDIPGGVVNILTGDIGEIGPWLATHLDVNALDLTGVGDEAAAAMAAEASVNLKRVLAPGLDDWAAEPGLGRMQALQEVKTVWHPIGV